MSAIAQTLSSILGSDGVIEWDSLDSPTQQRLRRAFPSASLPHCIAYPSTQAQLAEAIAAIAANRCAFVPAGSLSKIDWGGVPSGVQVILSTARLNRLIEHAVNDLTVTVEAGMSLASLQSILADAGQFLALDSAYGDRATLGGIVATGDTGSWRQRYGGVRDQLLGVSFVRSDGEMAKAGGRVVKNVAGYDLMKLFTGSYGTLGMICQVTFRVYPQLEASGTVILSGETGAIASASQTLLASALTPTAADLLSPGLVKQLGRGEEMGLLVRFQSVAESVQEQSARLMAVGETLGLKGTCHTEKDEADLWQGLRERMQPDDTEGAIGCKIGVRPTEAVAALSKFAALSEGSGLGQIHLSSGLGWLQFGEGTVQESVLSMRQFCQSSGGFLSVMVAPISVKNQVDVWGYQGNALEVMRKIKQQFDSDNILSPNRFIGGI